MARARAGTVGELFSTRYDMKVSQGAREIMSGRAFEKTRNEVSKSIAKGLALMQRHHVSREMLRRKSKSARGTKSSDKLYMRSGELIRSYRIDHRRGTLEGSYGSDLKRSFILEEGGTITPKKKMLAIPLPGVKGWPREYGKKELFPLRAKDGRLFLAKRGGGLMFRLVPSVTIRGRPTLENTVKKTEAKVHDLVLKALSKGMD